MLRPTLIAWLGIGLGLAACGDPPDRPVRAASPPRREPVEPEDLLVLSLPDSEVDAALAVLDKAGISIAFCGSSLGASGITVASEDYDAARRAFEAVPSMRAYVCPRDCPANGGPRTSTP